MDEIVNLLELFQGQLSLNDILNHDIPLINGLKKAKQRLNGEITKEREKQQRAAQQQAQQKQKK